MSQRFYWFSRPRVSKLTDDPSRSLTSVAGVEACIAESVWPETDRPDRFGVEAEAFPIVVSEGMPQGRIRLRDSSPSVLSVLDEVAATDSEVLERSEERLAYPIRSGGRITFEPGAQIEHATAPRNTLLEVVSELKAVWDLIRAGFWSHQVCLLSLGVDPWSDAELIPQQLGEGRYEAMAAHFGSRGPAGAVMMRNTCSLQISLDAGRGVTRQQRWVVANLISPVITAMFASSPAVGVRSLRARAWQTLDPTRTGFPDWNRIDDVDPIKDILERVLKADVIYINRNGVTIRGGKGWTFRDWVEEGHPTAGSPTPADLDVHLTTLFSEVRARHGTLELRGIDGIPQRWWHVPLLIAGALLYDQVARDLTMEALGPIASRLNKTWSTAAAEGLNDPELRLMAQTVAEIGVAAARRDSRRFDVQLTDSTEAFVEDFTFRGRSPADDLYPLLDDPRAALRWAEPDHALKGPA